MRGLLAGGFAGCLLHDNFNLMKTNALTTSESGIGGFEYARGIATLRDEVVARLVLLGQANEPVAFVIRLFDDKRLEVVRLIE